MDGFRTNLYEFLFVCSFDKCGTITFSQGEKERNQCYKLILEELDAQFPNRSKERYESLMCYFGVCPYIH